MLMLRNLDYIFSSVKSLTSDSSLKLYFNSILDLYICQSHFIFHNRIIYLFFEKYTSDRNILSQKCTNIYPSINSDVSTVKRSRNK